MVGHGSGKCEVQVRLNLLSANHPLMADTLHLRTKGSRQGLALSDRTGGDCCFTACPFAGVQALAWTRSAEKTCSTW